MKAKITGLEDAARYISEGNYVKAHQSCVSVIQQQGPHAHAYFLLGIIHIEIGQIEKAIKLFERANGIEQRPICYAYLAKCYALKGDMQLALDMTKQAPVEALERALELDTVGVSLSRVGLHHEAADYFKRALVLAPDNAQYHYNYAVSAKFAGQFAIARKHFEKAIVIAPEFYQAHFALSDLGSGENQSHHLARLETLATKLDADPQGRLHIGHALAKEYERIGQYDDAFNALAHAKLPHRQRSKKAMEDYQGLFDTLRVQLNQASMASDEHSDAPIFVVGMPRSGTTLVERILSHHSHVASGGELQDFGVAVKEVVKTESPLVLDAETLKQGYHSNLTAIGQRYIERTGFLHAHSPRFVDKLPFNFFYIDLIRRALPKAKIICLKRDGMDTCVGNYRQLFSIHSPYYAYAYDMDVIGRFYQHFDRWIEAFSAAYPSAIYVQSYEDLVTDPDSEVKALLRYCELPFEAQCVAVEDNRLPVSTASKVQVREPINTRSIGRWRRYQGQTKSLQALLAGG